MSLQLILDRQLRLQTESFGHDPRSLTGDVRAQYVRDMTLALIDELSEALNETGWKPWASSRHLHRDAYVAELVDALHFLANLFLVAGVTEHEITALYLAKAEKNRQRQKDGYDGVSSKCQECGRALDDAAVTCTSDRCAA